MKVVAGKWSIFENVVHLQTYQHVMIERIRRILEEPNPSFARYVADTDPLFIENCNKSSREIIQDLLTTRKEMAAGILSFAESDLDKTGMHPIFGKMQVVQWLNFFLLHEAHHLFTILKLSGPIKQPSKA
jgi:hypothetical protein